MKGVTRAAKRASGLSQYCGKCSIKYLCHANEQILRNCHRAFVEGFKKGARFVEQKSKENGKD